MSITNYQRILSFHNGILSAGSLLASLLRRPGQTYKRTRDVYQSKEDQSCFEVKMGLPNAFYKQFGGCEYVGGVKEQTSRIYFIVLLREAIPEGRRRRKTQQ